MLLRSQRKSNEATIRDSAVNNHKGVYQYLSGGTSYKRTSVSRWSKRNSNGSESDKPPAEINVEVVFIREFECGNQIKHLFTEFGVANYSAYSAGVLGVEDDDCGPPSWNQPGRLSWRASNCRCQRDANDSTGTISAAVASS